MSWRLAATVMVSTACTVGGTHAIPPPLERGDEISVWGDQASIQASDAGEPSSRVADAALDIEPATGDAAPAVVAAPDAKAPCGTVNPACEPPSGCTAAQHGEHTYFLCSEPLLWDDARARCQSAGTDLTIIEDEAENTFIADNLSEKSWIGANDQDTEGTWVWLVPGDEGVSGAPLGYARWFDRTKPDNCGLIFGQQDCARISRDGRWDDSACAGGCFEGSFAFVCESYR